MQAYLLEKIENVRKQPEHIRRRYVFVCLTISMLLIIGIWMLSLKEGFTAISRDVPAVVETSKKQLTPQAETPSLNELIEQAVPLRINGAQEGSGEDYFNNQVEERSNPKPNSDEGVALPQ